MEQLPPIPIDDARRFWDARFAQEGFVYGDAPNDVLREQAQALPPGDALCLAEGEGRNGVFLAELGHGVTVQDISPVGLAKAERLAPQHGVTLTTRCSDLQHDTPAAERADLVVATWILEETRRLITEGPYHHGESAVVRVLGRRPMA